jgi:autotransporter-associated beta strand protein
MPTQKTSNAILLKAILFLSFALLITESNAAVKTWVGTNGGGTSTNWSTAASWTNGTPVIGDSLLFGSSATAAYYTNNNNIAAGLILSGITFSNSATAGYVLNGNAIVMTNGGITNNSSFTDTINLSIGITNTIVIKAASSGNLLFGGAITGTGILSIQNTGLGKTILAASNNYSGGTLLNAGALTLSNSYALGTGTLTFASNSTTLIAATNLNLANAMLVNASSTINNNGFLMTNAGALSGAGTLTFTGGGTNLLSTSNGFTGAAIISSLNTLQMENSNALANAAGVTVSGGALGGGTLNLGGLTNNISSLILEANSTVTNGSLSSLSSLTFANDSNNIGFGAAVNISSIALAANGAISNLSTNNQTINSAVVLNGSNSITITNSGTANYSVIPGSSIVSLNGVISGTGTLTINSFALAPNFLNYSHNGWVQLTNTAVTNIFTGAIVVNNGNLSIGSDALLGSSNNGITLNNGELHNGTIGSAINPTISSNRTITITTNGGFLGVGDVTSRI